MQYTFAEGPEGENKDKERIETVKEVRGEKRLIKSRLGQSFPLTFFRALSMMTARRNDRCQAFEKNGIKTMNQ